MARTLRRNQAMDAHAARTKLLAQHDQIRMRLSTCSVLGRRLLDGERVRFELDEALAALRSAFIEHNATETDLIRPLLRDSPNWGTVLIDRMLEEHVAEHAAFWELLAGPAHDVALRIDELIEDLDSHMAAEERTFLSPLVLHPDAIARRQKRPI
ncbi:MAG: hemerythrin domain-containing protein [Kofleriaceae bacterium]